jgi:hypothetical protein
VCRHSVLDIATATGWTVLGSNLGEGEIFRTRPDRTWGPPSLLYNGYRVSFQGVRRSRRGIDHPPQCGAKVKERTQLHCHSGPSWPVIGCTLLLTFDSMHLFFLLPSLSNDALPTTRRYRVIQEDLPNVEGRLSSAITRTWIPV